VLAVTVIRRVTLPALPQSSPELLRRRGEEITYVRSGKTDSVRYTCTTSDRLTPFYVLCPHLEFFTPEHSESRNKSATRPPQSSLVLPEQLGLLRGRQPGLELSVSLYQDLTQAGRRPTSSWTSFLLIDFRPDSINISMNLPLAVLAALSGMFLGAGLFFVLDPVVDGAEGDFLAFLGVVGGGVDDPSWTSGSSLIARGEGVFSMVIMVRFGMMVYWSVVESVRLHTVI
jgi:hypothetical protein